MAGNPEDLSDTDLERMLLEVAAPGVSGRRASATVTAVRTILRRRVRGCGLEDDHAAAQAEVARAQQRQTVADEDARRALEIVKATRGPDGQLTEVHPTWVASVLADPGWAEVYVSDEEMHQAAARMRGPINRKGAR